MLKYAQRQDIRSERQGKTMSHSRIQRSIRVRVAGGALAVVIAGALTGCFANPLDDIVNKVSESSAKDAAEQIVEGMTGGDSKIEFGELPADFPKEIPLVSNDIMQSMTVEEGTMVVVMDSRGLKDIAAQVKSDFADWEEVASTDLGQMISAIYKKGDLNVTVTIMSNDDEEGSIVGYTVTPAEN